MALPVSDTLNVEDLTFTLSHNMPNKNAGHELLPMSDQYYFDALFLGRDADVAIYGHAPNDLSHGFRWSSHFEPWFCW